MIGIRFWSRIVTVTSPKNCGSDPIMAGSSTRITWLARDGIVNGRSMLFPAGTVAVSSSSSRFLTTAWSITATSVALALIRKTYGTPDCRPPPGSGIRIASADGTLTTAATSSASVSFLIVEFRFFIDDPIGAGREELASFLFLSGYWLLNNIPSSVSPDRLEVVLFVVVGDSLTDH